MRRLEHVSECLRATPPRICGVLDDQGKLHRLVSHKGEGRGRVFHFDLLGELRFSALLGVYRYVVIQPIEGAERLHLNLRPRVYFRCPACGARSSTEAFWDHYNDLHAVRPWWLNEEDWGHFMVTEFLPPPEWR